MRTIFKTLLFVTSFLSASLINAADSDDRFSALPTGAPSTAEVIITDDEVVASVPTECPCRALKRREEAEANRTRGRGFLPWDTVRNLSLMEWKEPVRGALSQAVEDFSEIPDVVAAINAVVDGIWAVLGDIQSQHSDMTLEAHYNFMTCYLGRLSQKNNSDAVIESLENLHKQHLGYAGALSETPIC